MTASAVTAAAMETVMEAIGDVDSGNDGYCYNWRRGDESGFCNNG